MGGFFKGFALGWVFFIVLGLNRKDEGFYWFFGLWFLVMEAGAGGRLVYFRFRFGRLG